MKSGFGECIACGCPVERVCWDELCFRCQESEKAEMEPVDERDADREDDYLIEPSDGRDMRGGVLP